MCQAIRWPVNGKEKVWTMKAIFLLPIVMVSAIATSAMVRASATEARSPEELVQACKAEAAQGHLRHLTTQKHAIDEHKQRMIDHCQNAQTVAEVDREKALRGCRKEAAWGARSHDRTHMLRLQRLCEKLAGQP